MYVLELVVMKKELLDLCFFYNSFLSQQDTTCLVFGWHGQLFDKLLYVLQVLHYIAHPPPSSCVIAHGQFIAYMLSAFRNVGAGNGQLVSSDTL
jgi:hypothetical protein